MKEDLPKYLEQFISEQRVSRFREVLSQRTGHMRVVLEDIYQGHNASAVLRSCDCFGVQHVHFIENRNKMRLSEDVAMGSSNWLTIHRHRDTGNNTRNAISVLKNKGYRIVCTSPHAQGFTLETLPVDRKFALVFGTEMNGISADAADLADAFVTIPMFGFTESFNISVCAALCMHDLIRRIKSTVPSWQLDEEEKKEVYLSWLRSSIDHSEAIVADYLNNKKV